MAVFALLGCSCVADAQGRPRGMWTPPTTQAEALAATCDGFCGGEAAAGCWCDDLCEDYGDCCPDLAAACEGAPPDADPEEDEEDAAPAVTVEALLELTADCDRLGGTSKFRTDAGRAQTIEICELNGAIWWRADADIDCDGGRSEPCTSDPWYQPETSSKDSQGRFIDSATVPHFVVPMASNGFVPKDHGIKTSWSGRGSAGILIYDGKMIYAPYADAGPRGVVGEMSAAAASELGIPNHPVTGGVGSGVTYIVFTDEKYVDPIESRETANAVGEQLAQKLLAEN